MRDTDYRDRYQRKLSKIRSKYIRRTWLVFIMALVLGFLIGWILYGRVMDDQLASSGGDLVVATAEPTSEPTSGPTWFDDADATEAPTEEPTAEPTAEATAEPTSEVTAESTDEADMSGFMDEATEAPTDEPTMEPTAEPTAEATTEPTAEATAEPTAEATAESTPEPTAEPTIAPKGSIDNPILIGEPFSFTAQLNADGTMRTEATGDAYYDLPITVTLSRYLLPDYYAETYSTQFQIKGDEAGAQLDITLGAVEGLDSVSMQDAVLVVYEDANGGIVQGYKFTDAEIGGESQSILNTGASGTVYKRFQYDATADLKYLTLTYDYDAQQTTLYFSLTDSMLPEETAEPEQSAQPTPTPTQAATVGDESYTIGSTGDGVKQLQQKLIDLGYLSGSPDGKFGKWTAEAVKTAQKALGLEETGVADAAFLDALYSK